MIRILKSTSYNGIEYREGTECKAPDQETADRWIKNGIAEEVNSKKQDKLKPDN